MKKFLLLVPCFLFSACVGSNNPPSSTNSVAKQQQQERPPEEKLCVTRTPKTVEGNSMEPLLPNGSKVTLLEDYYQCGSAVQKGDIVAYNFAGNKLPLIKKVAVTDQDEVAMEGGTILVNGEVLENSAGNAYNFSTNEQKMLALYIKEGKIPKDSVFIFGDSTGNSDDSRKFGAIAIVDLLGKFEITKP